MDFWISSLKTQNQTAFILLHFFLTQKVALISNHSVYVFSIEVQKKRILKEFARDVRIAVQKNCGT